MKKLKFILAIMFCFTSTIIFSGCTSGMTSLSIKSYPKIVYEVGETFSPKGLKFESLNADGTISNCFLSSEDISSVDTSSPGEKIVRVEKGNLSTTFNIYVANYVINNKSQLKSVIENASDGEIIYIKEGEYKPENNNDDSLYNIVINKKLTLIGDGKDKTILHGNFLVGASRVGNDYIGITEFEDVKFINLGFKLTSKVENRYLDFEGPYGSYDLYGAIKTFDSKKILVSGCSFSGYSYGLNCDTTENLTVIKSTFRDIKINGIKITNDIKNSTFAKNSFMDIGEGSLVMDNSKQGFVSAMFLSFNKTGNAGVIVANNTFVRIGLGSEKMIYTTSGADELELSGFKLNSGVYVNNSAIIHLVSSAENNLQVGGIIISMNNFGQTLENIHFGTTKENLINQAGVYINEA